MDSKQVLANQTLVCDTSIIIFKPFILHPSTEIDMVDITDMDVMRHKLFICGRPWLTSAADSQEWVDRCGCDQPDLCMLLAADEGGWRGCNDAYYRT